MSDRIVASGEAPVWAQDMALQVTQALARLERDRNTELAAIRAQIAALDVRVTALEAFHP
ncbi:hypothetical protein [Aurantimonas coralicida]|uniref:hypothetical protein n=1 Tax=Aurantimonas coralicida TaxID=182270 RepID=UPI001E40BA16|nr:hypothetical protein [Aurantimonas coralicida]MCD1644158.1 hypothetical protein [Aurantimonas coralicida]